VSFSYQYGNNPAIDYPRLLISDTQDENHVFEDQEILAATQIELGVWQSGMFWSGAQGVTPLPTPPVPYRRIAATLLDAIASNKSRLSSVTQLLDVHLSPEVAAKALRDQAASLRETDDNSGAFVIIEQVNGPSSFRDRWWKTLQRMSA
jgi:hypothetical protein